MAQAIPGPLRVMQYHDILIDLLWQYLNHQERVVHLSPKETRLFVALVDRAGEICDRDYLVKRMVGDARNSVWTNKDLDVNISHLRGKLYVLTGSRSLIETVVGEGYRLRR